MVFALEEGGNLRLYPGNYSIYLDYKKAEEEAKQPLAGTKEKPKDIQKDNLAPTDTQPKKKRISTWEKREFDQLEGKIASLEDEKAKAENAIANVPPGNYTQVEKLFDQVEALKLAIDKATERWMELAELDS